MTRSRHTQSKGRDEVWAKIMHDRLTNPDGINFDDYQDAGGTPHGRLSNFDDENPMEAGGLQLAEATEPHWQANPVSASLSVGDVVLMKVRAGEAHSKVRDQPVPRLFEHTIFTELLHRPAVSRVIHVWLFLGMISSIAQDTISITCYLPIPQAAMRGELGVLDLLAAMRFVFYFAAFRALKQVLRKDTGALHRLVKANPRISAPELRLLTLFKRLVTGLVLLSTAMFLGMFFKGFELLMNYEDNFGLLGLPHPRCFGTNMGSKVLAGAYLFFILPALLIAFVLIVHLYIISLALGATLAADAVDDLMRVLESNVVAEMSDPEWQAKVQKPAIKLARDVMGQHGLSSWGPGTATAARMQWTYNIHCILATVHTSIIWL